MIHTQKCKQHIKKIIPQMVEFHAGDENYFGEDYFSENETESEESDEEDYADPYTVAERLHRKGEHNPITRQAGFIDEYDIGKKPLAIDKPLFNKSAKAGSPPGGLELKRDRIV